MRESWTDDRLDHLSGRMDERFDRVERFREVDRRFDEIDKRFDRVDKRFDRVDADFKELRVEMNARFDSLQRALFFAATGMLGAFGAALIGALAT